MAAWEFTLIASDVTGSPKPNIANVWQVKASDGLTDWERLAMLGKEGWEMVNAFPRAANGGMSTQIV